MRTIVKNWELLQDIDRKIKLLTPEEQMYLIQQIAGNVSADHFVDEEELARDAKAMANDPGMQRVLRNEDLPYSGAWSVTNIPMNCET